MGAGGAFAAGAERQIKLHHRALGMISDMFFAARLHLDSPFLLTFSRALCRTNWTAPAFTCVKAGDPAAISAAWAGIGVHHVR
jgi:hypothetical protein